MAATLTERLFWKGEDDRFLECSMGLDLTGYTASDLTFRIRKPSGSTASLTLNRTIVDATTGIVRVDLDESDLDETGEYFLQVRANGSGLPDQRSPLTSFFVDDEVIRILDERWAFTPDSIPDFSGASAAEKALYGYFTDAAGLYPDGTSGAEWG